MCCNRARRARRAHKGGRGSRLDDSLAAAALKFAKALSAALSSNLAACFPSGPVYLLIPARASPLPLLNQDDIFAFLPLSEGMASSNDPPPRPAPFEGHFGWSWRSVTAGCGVLYPLWTRTRSAHAQSAPARVIVLGLQCVVSRTVRYRLCKLLVVTVRFQPRGCSTMQAGGAATGHRHKLRRSLKPVKVPTMHGTKMQLAGI